MRVVFNSNMEARIVVWYFRNAKEGNCKPRIIKLLWVTEKSFHDENTRPYGFMGEWYQTL